MKEDIGVQIQDEPLDIIEEIEGVKEDLFTMRKLSSGSDNRTEKDLNLRTKIAMHWIQIVVLLMQMLLKIRRI